MTTNDTKKTLKTKRDRWAKRNYSLCDVLAVYCYDDDQREIIRLVILAFDGAWRTGASPEEIALALRAKQAKNEARKWPDWRTADRNKAIEHDRSAEGGASYKPRHNKLGNCWAIPKDKNNDVVDVCKKHDECRGDCSECPRCPACDSEVTE